MKRKVEILSPAGSLDSLKAAVNAGADAVYVGGSRFGARAYANNLTEEQLLEAIDYVHLHGRSIYLTVNTLLKEKELEQELYSYLKPYYEQGLDAVIVQDIGVFHYIRKMFPDLPVHASTQMTITNVSGAKFLEKEGVERVVTAREMSLDEIREISEQTDLEIESFVHGALCYCYSGQCLYSSILGGRSGNRGQCAQPCRLPYKVDGKTSYVMSLKDLCTLDLIPDMVDAGISSFKIEGRMKKPEYVAAVTAIYRKYLDLYLEKGRKKFQIDKKDRDILLDLYNRGGFNQGYYKKHNGKEMLSLERPNHAGVKALKVLRQQGRNLFVQAMIPIHKGDIIELPGGENYTFGQGIDQNGKTTIVTKDKKRIEKDTILNRTRNEELLNDLKSNVVENKRKEKVDGELELSTLKSIKLKIKYKDTEVIVEGEPAQEAINQPMDSKRIEKQMRKTGNTEFEFDSLKIYIEGNIFVPMQTLNELRRKALAELEIKICEKYRRLIKVEKSMVQTSQSNLDNELEKDLTFNVYVEKKEQFYAVLKRDSVKRIYIDCTILERIWENDETQKLIDDAKKAGKELYFAMPYIFRKNTKKLYEDFFERYHFQGVLIRNFESYEFLSEKNYQGDQILDSNMYQFNQSAKDFWNEKHINGFTAPLELNYKELSDRGCRDSELIVYGYIQMMVSAQCIQKTTRGCSHHMGFIKMTDRYQKDFMVKNCCDYCYNIIYNTEPMCLLDQKKEIEKIQPEKMRLHFTLETGQETSKIMNAFEEVFVNGNDSYEMQEGFTRGHFKRGIK